MASMASGSGAFTSWSIKSVCVAFSILFLLTFCVRLTQSNRDISDDTDFYSFTVVDILDNLVSLERYRGMVTLVVNVASECGYTDNHYKGLISLQEMFGDTRKFTVLAFPCNQFGRQEPGSNSDIYHFAHFKMGATFPLFSKINVLHQDILPAWRYLMDSSGVVPDWNFWKYLVDHNGHVIRAWGPSTSPEYLYQYIKDAVDNINEQTKNGKNSKNKQKDEF